jgi:hypothetical protein
MLKEQRYNVTSLNHNKIVKPIRGGMYGKQRQSAAFNLQKFQTYHK